VRDDAHEPRAHLGRQARERLRQRAPHPVRGRRRAGAERPRRAQQRLALGRRAALEAGRRLAEDGALADGRRQRAHDVGEERVVGRRERQRQGRGRLEPRLRQRRAAGARRQVEPGVHPRLEACLRVGGGQKRA
jgi:hypothetical protein